MACHVIRKLANTTDHTSYADIARICHRNQCRFHRQLSSSATIGTFLYASECTENTGLVSSVCQQLPAQRASKQNSASYSSLGRDICHFRVVGKTVTTRVIPRCLCCSSTGKVHQQACQLGSIEALYRLRRTHKDWRQAWTFTASQRATPSCVAPSSVSLLASTCAGYSCQRSPCRSFSDDGYLGRALPSSRCQETCQVSVPAMYTLSEGILQNFCTNDGTVTG